MKCRLGVAAMFPYLHKVKYYLHIKRASNLNRQIIISINTSFNSKQQINKYNYIFALEMVLINMKLI